MPAMDAERTDISGLMKAVFNQAIRDYVKLAAYDVDSMIGVGNRDEIMQYLDTSMAKAGTTMNTDYVKKMLKKMTKEEALEHRRRLNANYNKKFEVVMD